MESIVFSDAVKNYICLHPECKIVVIRKKLEQHLRRKHKVPAKIARSRCQDLLKLCEGKQPDLLALRYINDPLPKVGEHPLPAVPELPVIDIVSCPFCTAHTKNVNGCYAHMRLVHVKNVGLEKAYGFVKENPKVKGQKLFNGSEKVYFHVTLSLNDSPILTGEGDQVEIGAASDCISLNERSANLSLKILGIPEFLEANKLSLLEEYTRSRAGDKFLYFGVVNAVLSYIQVFAEMSPPVPLLVMEAVNIRHENTTASFSLRMNIESKRRYARVTARFVILTANMDSAPLETFNIDKSLILTANKALAAVRNDSKNVVPALHSFFSGLLLTSARASMGETVSIEGLFKLAMLDTAT